MPLSRIAGRTVIMLMHAAFVPWMAWMLNGNWPQGVQQVTSWSEAPNAMLSVLATWLPGWMTNQPVNAELTNTWQRWCVMTGWWGLGYLVLFVGFGHLIRQLPDYVRAVWRNLKQSAYELAQRDARRE